MRDFRFAVIFGTDESVPCAHAVDTPVGRGLAPAEKNAHIFAGAKRAAGGVGPYVRTAENIG